MVSFMKFPFCLEWTTELPFENVLRRSPNIFFESFEGNLEFGYEEEQYYVKMFVKKELNALKYIRIMSFIYYFRPEETVISSKRHLCARGENILWSETRKDITAKLPGIFRVGKITVMCLFHSTDTHLDKKHVSTQTSLNAFDVQSLFCDFFTLLKDTTFSDVKLICADRTFSAHRSIVAARSEVFAAMFRNKMAEKENGVVHIKDVEPEVLELLLEYMYSAKKPDLLEETASLLYEAADKYAVHGLRMACSGWMVEHQTTNNCLDFLVLADKHSDENFKEAVICFISEHLADISVKSWSTFKNNYPLLALPLLEKRCEDSMPGAAKRARY